MNTLPKHRELEWQLAINSFAKKYAQGEVRFLDMDIVWDLETQYRFNTTIIKIVRGDEVGKKLFADMGMEKCKGNEADWLIIIGEKRDGSWVLVN